MAANNYVLCLDVGGTTIKAAEYLYSAAGEMILERFAFLDYGRDLEDDASEEADALHRRMMADAVKKVILENNFKAKQVNLCLSGKNTYIKFVKLPSMVSDEKKLKQIIEFEAASAIPFDLDGVVWDSQIISKDAEQAEIEAMFVVVKREELEFITDLIEKLGKEVTLIDVSPTAIYNAAKANSIGTEGCEMILNIGGSCSLLIFADKGRFFTRLIPIAGNAITHQISKEFGISYADAEEMKRKHGFVALGGAYEEPDSEVATMISKIVRNVMTRLHGEINRSINVYRSQQGGRKPDKIYLSGGGSVMEYTLRFFEDKLHIPAEYFNPFQKIAIGQDVDKEMLAEYAPAFPETTGLAVRNATSCPLDVALVPVSMRRCREFREKSPYFYASTICFLLIVLITFLCFIQQRDITGEKYNIIDKRYRELKVVGDKVRNAANNFNNEKGAFEAACNILKERSIWPERLEKIQELLPEGVWLSSFAFGVAANEPKKEERRSRRRRRQQEEMMFEEPSFDEPKAPAEPTVFDTVNFTCHYLKKNDEDIRGKFLANLEKSGLFQLTKDSAETMVHTVSPGAGAYNIVTFKISAKLKENVNR